MQQEALKRHSTPVSVCLPSLDLDEYPPGQHVAGDDRRFSNLDQTLLNYRLVYHTDNVCDDSDDDHIDASTLDALIGLIESYVSVDDFCWIHVSSDGHELGKGHYLGSDKPGVLLESIVELDAACGLLEAINARFTARRVQERAERCHNDNA